MPRMAPPNPLKLLALGAFGAIGGILLALVVLVVITIPGEDAGMNWPMSIVTWLLGGGVVLLLVAVHVVLARQLLAASRDA